jgi:hypothetical protein
MHMMVVRIASVANTVAWLSEASFLQEQRNNSIG